MKKLIFSSIAIFLIAFNSIGQSLSPYIKVGKVVKLFNKYQIKLLKL